MIRIYCLQSDPLVNEVIHATMTELGYHSLEFDGVYAFFRALRAESPDLILLDSFLIDDDSASVLSEIRRMPEGYGVPVVLFNTRRSKLSKHTCPLSSFDVSDLIKSVRHVIASDPILSPPPAPLSFGELYLDRAEKTCTLSGVPLSLTPTEYRLLCYFLCHADRDISRTLLSQKVFLSDPERSARLADVHVSHLRSKLGSYAVCLQNVRGVGYRFCGRPPAGPEADAPEK